MIGLYQLKNIGKTTPDDQKFAFFALPKKLFMESCLAVSLAGIFPSSLSLPSGKLNMFQIQISFN